MPGEPRPLAAVHYFYLLKSDEEDLQRLWSALAGAGAVDSGQSFSLGLTSSPLDGAGDRCRVVHRIDSPGAAGYRLCMLADMSVVEIHYPDWNDTLPDEWHRVMETIEADRDRLLSVVNGVLGETTVLVAAPDTQPESMIAAAISSGEILMTHLNPELGIGEQARLLCFPKESGKGRDYYALSAEDPGAFTTTVFPEFDSLVKKLSRTATYFEDQRRTILDERSEVDREVGALLHRQVVTGTAGAFVTTALEEQINNLSRMFGLLATDSLLVRQSSDSLSRDIKLLNSELKRLVGPGFTDEIGAYYITRFRLDLAEADAESRNLDFSRQNAQAAIEVVRTQVEIMRAGEEAAIQQQSREILSHSLVLQKERLALQVAAGFIEFVLVFYYVLKSWEGVAGIDPVEHISPLLRLLVIGGFSAAASVGTHFLARALQHQSWKGKGLWFSVAALVLALAAMVMLTIAYE